MKEITCDDVLYSHLYFIYNILYWNNKIKILWKQEDCQSINKEEKKNKF